VRLYYSHIPEVCPLRHVPLFVLVTACSLAVSLPGAAAADTAVRVVVTNVVKPDGVLLAGAYSGNVRDGAVTFEIALPPGSYALSILQDLNGNRKLDTNFIGIPTEASGSSNDAPAKWSAPKFQDAVFIVGDEPVSLAIRLN
jgi:uncharacterized protein (DUF2141 family)